MYLFLGMDLLEGIITESAYNGQKIYQNMKQKFVDEKTIKLEGDVAFVEKDFPKGFPDSLRNLF